ncbi:MAG: YlbF family regulator [Verrucomicrobiota bacterium]
MSTTTQNGDAFTKKIEELCQSLLNQPEFQSIRQRIETFNANDQAQKQYQTLSERGEYLQHKQQQGSQLSDAEIAEFEKHREDFFKNPVAKDYVDAQQQMHQMQDSVSKYVSKTFEMGRVPAAEDMESGSCGQGCGCH